ncbi:hypothetical protein HPB48_017000 [Haemaphysalis longicornis]|uniref:Uncharacterized protein n=1 Tax=Haemaphysalis longicornis TaxID=44386 RepID=A0A9J6G779_HAELO|nr:hypothetical protein HPB48_017000 [Haemaphysalis longicornis]
MRGSFLAASFLAAVVALLLAPACHGFFLGPLLSLTLLPYTIVYNLSGIAGVKIALCLKLLGLLAWWRAGISDETCGARWTCGPWSCPRVPCSRACPTSRCTWHPESWPR